MNFSEAKATWTVLTGAPKFNFLLQFKYPRGFKLPTAITRKLSECTTSALLRTSQHGPCQRLTCRHLCSWLFTTNTDDLWFSSTLRGSNASSASRRKPKLPVKFQEDKPPLSYSRQLFSRWDNRDTNEKEIILFFQSLHYKAMSFARQDLQSRLAGVPGAALLMCLISDHGAGLMYSWLASQCDTVCCIDTPSRLCR